MTVLLAIGAGLCIGEAAVARTLAAGDSSAALSTPAEVSSVGLANGTAASGNPCADLQWLSANRESSTDREGVTTDNGWLTAHYALADGNELEWHYGTLSTRNDVEHLHGNALGGEIAFPQARWLRKLDAAVYRLRDDYQWQGGALFSLVKDHLDFQIQRNVFSWAQQLSATKMAVDGNSPIGAIKLNFDYQHYAVSDGNTVREASLGIDADKLLGVPRPLRMQLGIHQRWAKFNSPYYWSPSARDETLGVGAGIAWERPEWQFSMSMRRNLALSDTTAPSWSIDASASFDIADAVSIGASYASGNGAPRDDAYWWQYTSVYVKVHW